MINNSFYKLSKYELDISGSYKGGGVKWINLPPQPYWTVALFIGIVYYLGS